MKKIFVIILGVFLISCNNHVEKKHNILFISIDDLRPTMNSYNYENEKMITPYMDKLASEVFNLIMLLQILQYVVQVEQVL